MSKLWIIKSYINYSLKVEHTFSTHVIAKYFLKFNFYLGNTFLFQKSKYVKRQTLRHLSPPLYPVSLPLTVSFQVTSFFALLCILSVFLDAYSNTYK